MPRPRIPQALREKVAAEAGHRCGYCFRWSDDGTRVIGLTPVGRATVVALKLNNEHLVRVRRRWVAAGWHPPGEQG